jgi:hypothetical protein
MILVMWMDGIGVGTWNEVNQLSNGKGLPAVKSKRDVIAAADFRI